MAAPFNNLRSKLNRAVAAYLVGAGAGTTEDVLPFTTRVAKTFPNTTVRARMGKPEPSFTGNYAIVLHITVRGSAAQDPTEANEEAARIAFDERVALTADAMMQTDNNADLAYTAQAITDAGRALAISDPDNHADMADFKCHVLRDDGFGDPSPDEQEAFWEEILVFEAVCSAIAVD